MNSKVTESFTIGGYTYELTLVNCGKDACKKCPHGPYWYMKINLRTGKTAKKYLGKHLPIGVKAP